MTDVIDIEIEPSPAGARQRRINPCDVVERYLVGDNVDGVAHRQVDAPEDLSRALPLDAGRLNRGRSRNTESPRIFTLPTQQF
jgi:hypothetical protein